MDLAELPAVGQFDGRLEVGDAAPLRAGLEHAAGALHRVGQVLAVGDGQAAGLLAVDVLAGLGRQRSTPARASGRRWRSGRRRYPSREQLAEVAVEHAIVVPVMLDRRALLPASRRLAWTSQMATHCTSGSGEHALEVIGATRADADDAERDLLARRHRALPSQRPRRDDRTGTRPPRSPPANASGDRGALVPRCSFNAAFMRSSSQWCQPTPGRGYGPEPLGAMTRARPDARSLAGPIIAAHPSRLKVSDRRNGSG